MNFGEIRDMVMTQSGNDPSDSSEYEPALTEYINEGYGNLLYEYSQERISTAEGAAYPYLARDLDVPLLPEHLHRPIADYATYLIYRNGNVSKQQRGNAFYSQYLKALGDARSDAMRGAKFTNLYNEQVY